MSICKELGIDDPVCWMNAIEPKVLDLWIAWAKFDQDPGAMKPAEEALTKLMKEQAG